MGWENVMDIQQGLIQPVRRTPLFVWVNLLAMAYLYRRMTRDFLGMGTTNKRLLGRKIALTKEEEAIADALVDPATLTQTFDSVGGLNEAKDILQEHVVWPFKNPDVYKGLCAAPSGVLLYGPPGTGKTLLARALAKELDSYFLNISVDRLFSKYVGESEKLAAAVFTLARKCQPCVIFVDEIDSLLSTRSASDSEVYNHAKTIFMTQWDGLATGSNTGDRILVVGATNRLQVLDDAVLRRLPIQLKIPPPNMQARLEIVQLLLSDTEVSLADDVNLELLASWTEGYSGSDLKELCKAAAVLPMRDMMRARAASPQPAAVVGPGAAAAPIPKLTMQHLRDAMTRVKASGANSAANRSPLFGGSPGMGAW